jgi:hypothetical protein
MIIFTIIGIIVSAFFLLMLILIGILAIRERRNMKKHRGTPGLDATMERLVNMIEEK